jgi:hypothetical protein
VYFANLDSYITAYQTQKVNVRNIAFRDVTWISFPLNMSLLLAPTKDSGHI